MKKLFIISNESIFESENKYFCDNLDMKSTPEGLNKNFEINIIARKSKKIRTHEINIKNINAADSIFSFLKNIFKNLNEKDSKFLIVSISPYTFVASLFLRLLKKKPLVYLRSNGYEEYKVILGFLGTVIIIRPGLGVVHPAVLLVFVAASLFAVRQILSRFLSKSDNTITTVAYTALVGSFWLTFVLPFVWKWPTSKNELLLIFSISILAAIAEICVIKALELAEATLLGPVHYTLIIWGVLYGFVFFDQIPDFWTWVGTALIILCGLYTVYRERIAINSSR